MQEPRATRANGIGTRLLAAALTFVVPGLGHAIHAHLGRASWWLAGAIASLFVPVAIGSRSLELFLPAFAIPALVALACVVDAFFAARTSRRHTRLGWVVFGGLASLVFLVPVVPFALAVSIRAWCVETFRIPSGSACPTVQVGDHIVVDKTAYRDHGPQRGDIVVHSDPTDPTKDFIRRVVAVGGDQVEFRGQDLVINGDVVPRRPLGEQDCEGMDVFEETLGTTHRIALMPGGGWSSAREGPERVAEGTVYLLGDNRDNSYDSRMIGPVPVSLVKGRARWRYYRPSTGLELAELQ